jgi:hypothetical protein
MKSFRILFIFTLFLYNNAYATTANCTAGECEFMFSHHYDSAKTNCMQTLVYEEVKTEYLNFTIIKTGEKCTIIDSQ